MIDPKTPKITREDVVDIFAGALLRQAMRMAQAELEAKEKAQCKPETGP